MKTIQINRIGLDEEKAEALAKGLNELLANYQVLYLNTRGYHWNIKGEKFFELHLKFEELYTDLLVKVDEIAERVLTLGETPDHTFSDYLEKSDVAVHQDVTEGRKAIAQILDAFKIIIGKQRVLLSDSADAEDEGTNALMSDYIREQEKLVWMYAAYLG
ncbi:MAG: DNA starvation/stationary phase protection protein [Saprospiraceae bacterium]|nr:DNA starvation/stationary phase protection protein [Saprospiraceae bacterium]MCB9318161.1 DNA starvation/stationary phase protection protein [Lewinellaceae bacterium]